MVKAHARENPNRVSSMESPLIGLRAALSIFLTPSSSSSSSPFLCWIGLYALASSMDLSLYYAEVNQEASTMIPCASSWNSARNTKRCDSKSLSHGRLWTCGFLRSYVAVAFSRRLHIASTLPSPIIVGSHGVATGSSRAPSRIDRGGERRLLSRGRIAG